MGKNLDSVKADGVRIAWRVEVAAALDEQVADQGGYDRAIRDVVAWLEAVVGIPAPATIAVHLKRGDARGFADKERT